MANEEIDIQQEWTLQPKVKRNFIQTQTENVLFSSYGSQKVFSFWSAKLLELMLLMRIKICLVRQNSSFNPEKLGYCKRIYIMFTIKINVRFSKQKFLVSWIFSY